MKKILVASLKQESNTFSPVKSTCDDFTVITGEDMLDKIAVTEMLRGSGYEVVPTVHASSTPGGILDELSFLRLENRIIEKIPDDADIAGVWLNLHGAMQVENIGSGEAHLAAEIRKKIGHGIPVAAALDFHANISAALINNVNIVCGYRTAPHTDEADTQIKAAKLLLYCIEKNITPKPFMIRIPLLLPGEMATTGVEPVRSLLREVDGIEAVKGVLCSTFFCGMAWIDSPDTGACIVTVSDGNIPEAVKKAGRVAGMFLSAKEKYHYEEEAADPEAAIDMAENTGKGPVYITDSGDNVTAGAPGDNVFLLELLLKKHSGNVLYAGITDAEAVDLCDRHNIGDILDLELGGTLDHAGHRIGSSGTLVWKGKVTDPMAGGNVASALVKIRNIDVIITRKRCAFITPVSIESTGVKISDYHMIIVKQGYLYDKLRKTAARSIMALTPGSACLDIKSFEYRHVRRPIYPLDNAAGSISDNFVKIFNGVIKGLVGFFKGQLILSCITYIILLTGLIYIKVPVPYLIALGITIFDILPVVGSGMVMIPWAVISLITGNTDMAAGLAVLYLILTVARELLEPVIIGKKIGVRPLYTFLSSVIGSIIFGPFGFIIGPVIAIIINSVYRLKKTNERK